MSRRSGNTTKVFVGSLPSGTTPEELRELFAPYGTIAECDVVNRCGFLHLEDKSLAFKAITELDNKTFKGARISVEKGRVKSSGRDSGGGRGPRNGYGGPVRGGRDSYRGGPYSRDKDFDRRGPPRSMAGGGYERGSYMNDRRGYDGRRYDGGYMGGDRMYSQNNYRDNRSYERRPVSDRNLRNITMTDGPPVAPPMINTPPVPDNMHTPIPAIQSYDRRIQPDTYNRRDLPPKSMSNVGYTEPSHLGYDAITHNVGYENAPPPRTPGYEGGVRNPPYNSASRNPGYDPVSRNPGYDTAPRNPSYEAVPRNLGYDPVERNPGYDAIPRNNTYDAAYPPLQSRNYAGIPSGPNRRY